MRKRPSSQTSIKSFFAPVASAESCQESDSCHIAKRPKTASGAGGSISGACLEGGIPDRNPHRHAAAQRKLVGGASWSPGGEGDVGPVKGGKKYTPLEQQVMKLKKQYSGVILIIEVKDKVVVLYHLTQFCEAQDVIKFWCIVHGKCTEIYWLIKYF